MTPSAWIMLTVTWAVISFFTGRFFWRVLTLPMKSGVQPPPPPGEDGT